MLDNRDAQGDGRGKVDADATAQLHRAAGQDLSQDLGQEPGHDLLDCLLLLARAHGRTLTADAALAGLPESEALAALRGLARYAVERTH